MAGQIQGLQVILLLNEGKAISLVFYRVRLIITGIHKMIIK